MWVMGEWAVGHWIVGVTSFQKIYGLYSVEHHKMEKWSYYVGCGWVLWVWWFCVGDGGVGSRSLDSGCHQLSENIWFVIKCHIVEIWSDVTLEDNGHTTDGM